MLTHTSLNWLNISKGINSLYSVEGLEKKPGTGLSLFGIKY